MKTILVIRHAKSSWDNISVHDFDRPLNERGKRDAPAMAQRLVRSNAGIDLFVSSPAKRAKSTAEFFVREFGGREKDILLIPALYHASLQVFKEVLTGLDDRYSSVAIFSHNPGITSFVNSLTAVRLDNMPTCGVFAAKCQTDHWCDFMTAHPEFWFFDYPKSGGVD